jgi:hypothetical protein
MQSASTEDINFEVFPYKKGEPGISINSQHKISFNKGAWFALGQCESALLKFDPDKRIIGIEPCTEPDRRAFPVRRHNANNAYMYAKPFLDYYGLKVKKTTQYAAEVIDGELVVRL